MKKKKGETYPLFCRPLQSNPLPNSSLNVVTSKPLGLARYWWSPFLIFLIANKYIQLLVRSICHLCLTRPYCARSLQRLPINERYFVTT